MIRVLIYLLLLALLAYGGMWLVQNPGHVTMTWHNEVVEAPAALLVAAIAIAAIVLWSLTRLVFGLPSFVKFAARQRRREKGYAALSRGLIAVGSGDGRGAGRAATQAARHLKDDPLAVMLRAQAAHMNNEPQTASAAFEQLTQNEETRVLGLRGLHAEALRRGDEEAARHFADAAHRASPLPWSAQAVLEHRASQGDWERALATVESSLAARLIDRESGERQRAVLETAIAYDKEQAAPEAALAMARSAMKRAPDLVPAVVLVARLLTRRGDIRKASKIIERAWPRCQHPDLAQAYLDVRPGDSTADRLTRAQTLMGIATFDPVSRMAVARAALAGGEFVAARSAMAPLIAEGKRPTVRQCMMMAELDEAEHGDAGLWREWLARAARAPLDPAWIADGIVYDHWAPASPTTGKLDAFQWQVPAERLGPAIDNMPIPRRWEDTLPPPSAALIHSDAEEVTAPSADPGSGARAEPAAAAVPLVLEPIVSSPTASASGSPAVLDKVIEEKKRSQATASEKPASTYAAPPSTQTAGLADGKMATQPVTGPSAHGSAETPTTMYTRPDARADLAEPSARINLPPDTLPEERNPHGERHLFHRRLTPDAEARVDRLDQVTTNGGTDPQSVERRERSENETREARDIDKPRHPH